jgi:hypothetical protein
MDDRLREFGGVPGYEFDVPGAYGRPGPVVGGGGPPRQTWPQEPAGNPAWPVRSQLPQDDQSAGPGRPTLLARETLAAMRARNWLTSLAAPVLAAVAVGVAGVLLVGANNGGGAAAPSALAAGFPPAQSAAADFGGGGLPVEVSAIAAAGATEVAVGSANRGGALWVSADGGSTWHRGALTPPAAGGASAGQLAGVAHGPSGWLAVGGDSTATTGTTAMSPAVVGSPDGRTWTVTGSPAAFGGPGRIVTAAVAAGPGGYVIVGKASTGTRTVAAAWYAPGLTGWRRAADARPGALDGAGNRAMNAVSATSRGFVAVGAVGERPAAWVSGTGRTWTLVTLALPADATSAALDYVAANGGTVAAVGTEVTAAGQRRPFAAVSTDAGATWTQAQLPLPLGGSSAAGASAAGASATALTAAGGGFTATGTYGPPGETDVVVWTLPAGAAEPAGWTQAAPEGTGLAGPGMQAITALTATGATLTGVGFTSTSAATAKSMLTEPTIWQSPIRS